MTSAEGNTGAHRGRVAALLALMAVPIIAAYVTMARYAVNVPLLDDYPTVLGFAVHYDGLGSFAARLQYILADQHVEYKLVLVHLLTALELAVTHHASVSFLFWIGNLSLLPLLYVTWRMYFVNEGTLVRRLTLFLPVVFYFFSVNYWEAMDVAASALGYVATISLSVVAIYLLTSSAGDGSKSKRQMAGACAAALTAYLISASGFSLLPLGLLVLALRRAWGWFLAWGATFLLAIVPYLISFSRVPHKSEGSVAMIPVFFLSFLGGGTIFNKLAIPTGIAVLVICGLALRSRFYRTHPAAVLTMLWLLGSAAMASLLRGRSGLEFATASRYRIFSDLLLIFCYGYVADRVARSALSTKMKHACYGAAVLVSALFCLRTNVQAARSFQARRTMLLMGLEHYREAPKVNSPMYFNDPRLDTYFADLEVGARADMNAAILLGLYDAPPATTR